jgi:hypothetical protein
MRVKRCRSCEDVDVTANYREDAFVVLCAACHVDFRREAEAQPEPETRVWFAQEVSR